MSEYAEYLRTYSLLMSGVDVAPPSGNAVDDRERATYAWAVWGAKGCHPPMIERELLDVLPGGAPRGQ